MLKMKLCNRCKTVNEDFCNNCTNCGNRLPNSKRMYPIYCDSIVIALCFALWIFVVPPIIGIYLIWKQKKLYNKNFADYEKNLLDYSMKKAENELIHQSESEAHKRADEIINNAEKEASTLTTEAKKHANEIVNNAEKEANILVEKSEKLKGEIKILQSKKEEEHRELKEITSETMYELSKIDIDENVTSEEYKNKLHLMQLDEKNIVTNCEAVDIIRTGDSKEQKADIKQILRRFNSECATIIASVTVKNIDSSRNKIMRTFDTINKIFITDGIAISQKLLENKLTQLTAKYQYEYQKEQEKLQQKAIREQMIEEEKARREIEREKEKLSKEENQFKNEIDKLMKYMQKSQDIEKQLYISQIEELQKKLSAVQKDKEDVLHREQNTRAGFVYVISNIGSFGENIYKIGMTRRLEPMDRINELSSASVPFEFDVHAMIFSDDAPGLETILHNTFEDRRVNLVNTRKEFFNVSLDEIEAVVKANYNATVTFTKTAEAYQYRESLRIREAASVAV